MKEIDFNYLVDICVEITYKRVLKDKKILNLQGGNRDVIIGIENINFDKMNEVNIIIIIKLMI